MLTLMALLITQAQSGAGESVQISLAWITLIGAITASIVTGLFSLLSRRMDRANARTDVVRTTADEAKKEATAANAQATSNSEKLVEVDKLQGLVVALAEQMEEVRQQARVMEVELRKQVDELQTHSDAQDEQLAGLWSYIDQVDHVISSAPDEATIGSLRPQLPIKPTAQRPQLKRKAGSAA
jgi:hypothetical protein